MRYRIRLFLFMGLLILSSISIAVAQSGPSVFAGFSGPSDLGGMEIFHYQDNFFDQQFPTVQFGAVCSPNNETCASFENEGGVDYLRLALNGGSANASFADGFYYTVDVREDPNFGPTFTITPPEQGHCWTLKHRARYFGFGTGADDGTAGGWFWEYPFVDGVVIPPSAMGTQWLSPNATPQLSSLAGNFTVGLVISAEPAFGVQPMNLNMTQWHTYVYEWCNQQGVGQKVVFTVEGVPGQRVEAGNFALGDLLPEFWVDNQNGFQTQNPPTVDTVMDIDWYSAEYD